MRVTFFLHCFPRLMGETLRKSLMFLTCIYVSKRIARTWKTMEEVVVQDLSELKKKLESA
jgi:hypothetical protein